MGHTNPNAFSAKCQLVPANVSSVLGPHTSIYRDIVEHYALAMLQSDHTGVREVDRSGLSHGYDSRYFMAVADWKSGNKQDELCPRCDYVVLEKRLGRL